MIQRWLEPFYHLYGGYGYYYLQIGVPKGALITLQIAAVCLIFSWFYFDRKQFIRKTVILILADYVAVLICSTIVFRSSSALTGWNFMPFWSYQEIVKGRDMLLMGNILNILLFLPIGFLACFIFAEHRLVKTLIFGTTLSLIIELGQFIFSKGYSEIDDIIHNTIGCMIGSCFCVILLRFVCYLKQKV